MWISLGLLIKKHFQFPCFGWTLKVCIVFILLTSTTSLACFGGGGGGGGGGGDGLLGNDTNNTDVYDDTETTTAFVLTFKDFKDLDEKLLVNLTGITDPLERNIKTAWDGWEPSDETKKEWEEFYKNWQAENEKIGEGPWNKKDKHGTGGDGSGGPEEQDFTDERGPGSGWPNSPGWADLGVGSSGAPVPPWAYVPKNIGKPAICYLPPIKGTCKKGSDPRDPEQRWGYNPYLDECQEYTWSGCGGTRNKFILKEKCEELCQQPAPPTCAVDSGIPDKS